MFYGLSPDSSLLRGVSGEVAPDIKIYLVMKYTFRQILAFLGYILEFLNVIYSFIINRKKQQTK